MFNNKSGRDAAPMTAAAMTATNTNGQRRGIFSVIGPDVVITGNVRATADLHVDGHIDGDVHCAALVLGAEGRVTGNVNAETARIAGTVEGMVAVHQLTVEKAARIAGDVEYQSISIENGASIDGRLKHVSAPTAPKPVTPKLTAPEVVTQG